MQKERMISNNQEVSDPIRKLNIYARVFNHRVFRGAMRQIKIKTELNLDFLSGFNALAIRGSLHSLPPGFS